MSIREILTIKIGMEYMVRANHFLMDDTDGDLCCRICVPLKRWPEIVVKKIYQLDCQNPYPGNSLLAYKNKIKSSTIGYEPSSSRRPAESFLKRREPKFKVAIKSDFEKCLEYMLQQLKTKLPEATRHKDLASS